MKKLIFILALFIGVGANAQEVNYGATGRFGAFKTFGDSKRPNSKTGYGLGLQGALGIWVKLPLTPVNAIQVTLLQIAEHQDAGEITIFDENRSPITDATVSDRNLAAAIEVVYLHHLSGNWSIGIGTGARYEYLSKAKIVAEYKDWNYTNKIEETNNNTYRRDLTFYLPLETHYTISQRVDLVSQVRLQLSNRLNTSDTEAKQHDAGFSMGVNYRLK